MKERKEKIIHFIQEVAQEKKVVIGLSGGIDSTVVAFLLVEALGSDAVRAYTFPSRVTRVEDITDAQEIGTMIGVPVEIVPIAPIAKAYSDVCDAFIENHALGNMHSRIRMTLLYGYANASSSLVAGTGNKSEMLTGYFTKYGDGGVDFLPIAHLYKTEVWKLAEELQVPEKYIQKTPTAGLFQGQTDEADLGMTYHQLDAILQGIENGEDLNQYHPEKVQRVQSLMENSAHKRSMPPSLM